VVVAGDEVAHQRAALRQPQPGHRAVVLDRDRHPGERTLIARGDRIRGAQRAVAVDLDEGAESRVERLDPLERLADQLARGALAIAHQRRQLARRPKHQLVAHRRREPTPGQRCTRLTAGYR
jgi:hypothetical protein